MRVFSKVYYESNVLDNDRDTCSLHPPAGFDSVIRRHEHGGVQLHPRPGCHLHGHRQRPGLEHVRLLRSRPHVRLQLCLGSGRLSNTWWGPVQLACSWMRSLTPWYCFTCCKKGRKKRGLTFFNSQERYQRRCCSPSLGWPVCSSASSDTDSSKAVSSFTSH